MMPLFLSGHLKAAIIVPSFKHTARRAQLRDKRPENRRDREVFPHLFPKSSPQPPFLSWKVPSGRAEATLDLSTDCIVACRRWPPELRAMRGVIEHRGRAPQRAAWRQGLTVSLNRLHPHTASALPWCKGRRRREVLQCSHPQPRAATPIPARAEPRAGSPGKPGKPGLPPAASAR